MSEFKAKMHQIQFRLGLRSAPDRAGGLQCFSRSLAGFKGPTSKRKGGKWESGEGGVPCAFFCGPTPMNYSSVFMYILHSCSRCPKLCTLWVKYDGDTFCALHTQSQWQEQLQVRGWRSTKPLWSRMLQISPRNTCSLPGSLKHAETTDHVKYLPAFYPTSYRSEERWMFSAACVCLFVCLSTR